MLTEREGKRIRLDPDRVVRVLVVVIGVLLAGHALAVTIHRGIGVDAFPGVVVVARLLNVDTETNLPSWYSAAMLLATGVVALVIGLGTQGRWRRHWYAFAGALAFLSLDESALVHEELARPASRALDLEGTWEVFAWTIPYALLAALLVAAFAPFVLSMPSGTRNHVLAAGVMFVAGAVGVELIGRDLYDPFDVDATYLTVTAFEELLEMAAVVVLLRGLLRHLGDEVGPVVIDTAPADRA